MKFVDVVFPLNLGPLTYAVAEGVKADSGMMVKARIKNALKKGIITGPSVSVPETAIKEIEEVVGDALSIPMLRLVSWMSGYYFCREGSVLKSVLPREFWGVPPSELGVPPGEGVPPRELIRLSDSPADIPLSGNPMLDGIKKSASKKTYKTFLYRAGDTNDELKTVVEAAEGNRGVIVLCPEHALMERVYGEVKRRTGERAVLYHGGLKVSEKKKALQRIISGDSDVVVGSRMAVFAPLKEVSLISVMREESVSYKEEGGIKYGARDMAVMRGYLEGAAVFLSSILPSVESYHNALSGKYTLFHAPGHRRPEVRVIDTRKARSPVAPKVRFAVEADLKKGGRAVFVINRRGYSLLKCGACEEMRNCGRCGIPLEFFKTEKQMRCRHCGAISPPPQTCPVCGGLLEPVGAGIERILEELEDFNPKAANDLDDAALSEGENRLVVGTKKLSKGRPPDDMFSLVVFLNADSYLHAPDFRASERALRDMLYMTEKVKPGGRVFIQTGNPGAPLYAYLRKFDLKGFYKSEFGTRESLSYPPFSRMALISSPKEFDIKGVPGGADLLGPVRSHAKKGKTLNKLLVKAPSRKELEKTVRWILSNNEAIRPSVDVDPVMFSML